MGVLSRSRLVRAVRSAQRRGQRVVFTNGCFDLLHAGHIRLLRFARSRGERLVVGLNTDRSVRRLKGAGRPWQPQGARAEILAAIRYVDWICLFNEDTPARLIAQIQPEIGRRRPRPRWESRSSDWSRPAMFALRKAVTWIEANATIERHPIF